MMDFSQMTETELALVQSCGPDERCLPYGGEYLKLPVKTIEAIFEAAFHSAYREALSRADGQTVTGFDLADIEAGATTLTVRLTTESGEVITATAPIPDPRVKH